MADDRRTKLFYERAKRRLEYMERAANSRGILATKVEPQANGGIDNFVEGASPYLDIYWSLEIGGEDEATAELCLWLMDNPLREHSHCFYLRYSGAYDTWEFGFEQSPDSLQPSPKARMLAEKAFGFKNPGAREVDEPPALSLINALCAGFAATLPKPKKTS